MKEKYFLYTRVSDDEYIIDDQIEVLLKIAKEKKINKKDIIILEEHESGKKDNKRPLFDEMMSKLHQDIEYSRKHPEERVYGWILFFKIDRLARNDKDFEKLLRLLDSWYQFISATETIENTPTGRLLFRLLAWFAVYESEKLSSRITLSRIHSLIKKEFESLGGDIVIFGYEYDKQKKSIVPNNKEKNIIIKIYDQFLSTKKPEYINIFQKIDKEYDGYLTKYLTRKIKTKEWKIKTAKTTPEKLIRNIIVNDNAMRYNWFIEINLGVNDELIKNYLETIKQNNIDNNIYSLEGDVKIWGEVKFIYFAPELIIIPDSIYKETVDKSAKNKNILTENKEKWLFSDILFVDYKWKIVPFSWKIDKKKWKYINYRIKVWRYRFNVSEKKIENKILSKRFIGQIANSIDKNFVDIKNYILLNRIDSEIFKVQRKTLIANINIFRGMKEYYEYQLKMSDTKEDTEFNLKSYQQYKAREESAILKESHLLDSLYSYVEKYLEIVKIKDIKKETYSTKRFFYQIVFQKIIYRRIAENQFQLILEPFTFLPKLLWLPKEIVI